VRAAPSLTVASADADGRRFDARTTSLNRRVSPWTARGARRSADRSGSQRWRVRFSGVGGRAQDRARLPRGQGARGCAVAPQPPGRAARARSVAGSWPWLHARAARGFGGWGRHPHGHTGRGQKRRRRCASKRWPGIFCPEKPFEWVRSCCSVARGSGRSVTWGRCPPMRAVRCITWNRATCPTATRCLRCLPGRPADGPT